MAVISATEARKRFSELVNKARYANTPVLIGRHDTPEVLMIKFPAQYNPGLSETTNMSQYGGAFDFLADEPELYSYDDIKKRYD